MIGFFLIAQLFTAARQIPRTFVYWRAAAFAYPATRLPTPPPAHCIHACARRGPARLRRGASAPRRAAARPSGARRAASEAAAERRSSSVPFPSQELVPQGALWVQGQHGGWLPPIPVPTAPRTCHLSSSHPPPFLRSSRCTGSSSLRGRSGNTTRLRVSPSHFPENRIFPHAVNPESGRTTRLLCVFA